MPRKPSCRVIPIGVLLALSACTMGAQQVPEAKPSQEPALGPLPAPYPKQPAEMAPNPPRVTCHGSQLTIVAENSTMRSVLAAIQACTGTQIDIPATGAEERSYLHLGPGSIADVMEALLSPTQLDYVIQPSPSNPDTLLSVLIVARSKETKDAGASALASTHEMTPTRRAWLASRNIGRPPATPDADDQSSPEEQTSTLEAPFTDATVTSAAPVTAAVSALRATPDTDAASGTTPAADTKASANPPGLPSSTETQDPTPATASSNAGQDTAGAQDLQNKISDMQQLFEQRKKMTSTPAAPPN